MTPICYIKVTGVSILNDLRRKYKQKSNHAIIIELFDDDSMVDVVVGKPKDIPVWQAIDPDDPIAWVQASQITHRDPRIDDDETIRLMRRLQGVGESIIPIPEGKKFCSCCGDWVKTDAFSPNKSNRDGLHSHCKLCRADHARKMYWEGKQAA